MINADHSPFREAVGKCLDKLAHLVCRFNTVPVTDPLEHLQTFVSSLSPPSVAY